MGKIAAAGIGWFSREDYPRILEIMEDAHVLPASYDLWRERAEGSERSAEASGLAVVRAIINPEEFVAWCAREGRHVDAKARTAFAAEFARRQRPPLVPRRNSEAKAKSAADELVSTAFRVRADALEIKAQAKHHLADEYDAARERGEIGESGACTDLVTKEIEVPIAADLGLSREEINEARIIGDAEQADPGSRLV